MGRLRRPATRVWEPQWTEEREDGARILIPGAGSPGPPGPPCRPTGPSSRALLLAGIRRVSSKFLLTLAAPVSLPAAGSVLEEKAAATSNPTWPQHCPQTRQQRLCAPNTPRRKPRASWILQGRVVTPSDPSPKARLGLLSTPTPAKGRPRPGQDQVPSETQQWGSPSPPSPSPSPTHFFSFSPTAGDAAGLLSFSLGGDGE